MNLHKNSRLTPCGRALLAERVEGGWPVKAAALAAGVSDRTAHTWLRRHRESGERRHHDRSSAPPHCPHATPVQRIAEIEALRRQRLSGPQVAVTLGMPRSTVGAIPRRLGLNRLSALEPRPEILQLGAPLLLPSDRACCNDALPAELRRGIDQDRRIDRLETQHSSTVEAVARGARNAQASRFRSSAVALERRLLWNSGNPLSLFFQSSEGMGACVTKR